MNTTQNGVSDQVAEAKQHISMAPDFFNALTRLEAEYYQLSQLSLFVEITKVELERMQDIRKQVLGLRATFRATQNEI